MTKKLINFVLGGACLANSLVSFANANPSQKNYQLADGSTLEVKTAEALSVDSSGRGLVKVNGNLYVVCGEYGDTYLSDFGKNANPKLVKDSDGTYDVIVEDGNSKTYYDWDKEGTLTTKHYMK